MVEENVCVCVCLFQADHNDFTIPHWDEDEDPDDSDDKEEASCRHFK